MSLKTKETASIIFLYKTFETVDFLKKRLWASVLTPRRTRRARGFAPNEDENIDGKRVKNDVFSLFCNVFAKRAYSTLNAFFLIDGAAHGSGTLNDSRVIGILRDVRFRVKRRV